jgi:hypothetical protein
MRVVIGHQVGKELGNSGSGSFVALTRCSDAGVFGQRCQDRFTDTVKQGDFNRPKREIDNAALVAHIGPI